VIKKSTKYKNKKDKFSSHSLVVNEIFKLESTENDILDIGCSSGELLNRVKLSQKASNNYFGADLNNYLDKEFTFIKFYTFDFNNGELSKTFDNQQFDIIILADILEHLVDPWIALDNIEQITKPSTKILISIPNSGHWYFRFKVLIGRLEYQNNGLFDKTHLRFFTKKSAKELVSASKFREVFVKYSSLPWENIFESGLVTRLLSLIERSLIWIRPQLFAYQFIFLIEPRKNEKSLKP
jgi:2-polyprenyl-3-methyl-5-hydroxy-6-metoxy-1,4-benzoquinol methylase